MPSRAELEIRAAAVGIDPSTVHNDSVLEQQVLYNEKNADASTGAKADGTLTSTGTNASDGNTVTIGEVVYRLKDTPEQAYDVQIGADAATTLDNLKAAINASGTPGTEYFEGTHAHPLVTATTNTNTTQVVVARDERWGNSIATTAVGASLSWDNATLTGGDPKVVSPPASGTQAVSGEQYV